MRLPKQWSQKSATSMKVATDCQGFLWFCSRHHLVEGRTHIQPFLPQKIDGRFYMSHAMHTLLSGDDQNFPRSLRSFDSTSSPKTAGEVVAKPVPILTKCLWPRGLPRNKDMRINWPDFEQTHHVNQNADWVRNGSWNSARLDGDLYTCNRLRTWGGYCAPNSGVPSWTFTNSSISSVWVNIRYPREDCFGIMLATSPTL